MESFDMNAHASRIAEAASRYLPTDAALTAPALRSFFRLAEHWDLRVAEQRKLLGDPPESTFYKWKREQDGSLGRDTLERISYLLGIWKDLQSRFPIRRKPMHGRASRTRRRCSAAIPRWNACCRATWPTCSWCASIWMRSAAEALHTDCRSRRYRTR